jgi:prephenate dehydrogenase
MLGLALMANRAAAGLESLTLFDRDRSTASDSLGRGAGDAVGGNIADAFRAGTVVLATPVDQIVNLLDEFGPRVPDGSLVIDTGSAKGAVVAAMRRSIPLGAHAVGGHPMAGTERSGPGGADFERLHGATFVLSPVREDPLGMDRAAAFARSVGALPLQMDADVHDGAVAFTSHLPHLLAFALASATARDRQRRSGEADPALVPLVSTGFLGASRLAESDPAATAAFLCANAAAVEEAASAFETSFASIVRLLHDPDALAGALASARDRRRALVREADR